MNVSDPVTGALFMLVMDGVWFWWTYAAGLAVGLFLALRGRGRVQDGGVVTLIANLAPLAVLVALIPVGFGVQLLLGGPLPDWLVIGPTVLALSVGPVSTVWLLCSVVWSKMRPEAAVG